MAEITARVCIDGREVDYIDGSYKSAGNLTAAELNFKLPLTYGGMKKLWNREVKFYLNEFDTVPMFRGWIRRTNETFNDIEIIAQDGFGYMREAGDTEVAKIALTSDSNLDGLTIGAAIVKALSLSNLDDKIKTDFIQDTTPHVSTVRQPIRGTKKVLEIFQDLLKKAIDKSGTLPRPNIARIIDDGTYNQLLIELESLIDDSAIIKHVFTESVNIISLNIINKKVPTIIIVNGRNGVKGTFTHTSAMAALDRTYLEINNDDLTSPAACKEFGADIFQANLKNQYEYTIKTFEGAYLNENDVIRIETDDKEFAGNYRIIGKSIKFSPSGFSIGLTINRKPPTLAEYISSSNN